MASLNLDNVKSSDVIDVLNKNYPHEMGQANATELEKGSYDMLAYLKKTEHKIGKTGFGIC